MSGVSAAMVEHHVDVGDGRTVFLRQTQPTAARGPRRAILLLPGPLATSEFLDVGVPGHHAGALLAEHGFHAFSADLLGSGRSAYPAHGRDASKAQQIEAMRAVAAFIRAEVDVPKIDVLGESWGGGVAAELAAHGDLVRSCVLGSMIHRTASEHAEQTFRSPQFRGLLDSLPDGYLMSAPPMYEGLVAAAPPAVREWVVARMPGRYTTAPLLDVFSLPFFDPTRMRVPALIINGEADPNQPRSDAERLAADCGGGGKAVFVAGAGHVPRLEANGRSEAYWSAVLAFLEAPR